MRGKYVVNQNCSQQTRAISSPSLSEQVLTDGTSIPSTDSKASVPSTTSSSSTNSGGHTAATTATQNRRALANAVPLSGSVLQKLRNTFSQLKGAGKSTTTPQASDAAAAAAGTASISAEQSNSSNSNANHTVHTNSTNNANSSNNTSSHLGTLNPPANDTTTYRFGPLVWRTSKERRKTKTHRRDKCNSGDSGIQVELDGIDEPMTQASSTASDVGHDAARPTAATATTESATASPVATVNSNTATSVRRANSAKAAGTPSTSAAAPRARFYRQHQQHGSGSERFVRALPVVRSHSQPNGLDRLTSSRRSALLVDEHVMTASAHAGGDATHDNNISASDSDDEYSSSALAASSSHADASSSVFAQVLYPFRPASEQELALEQGALVEVLHREPGPWWWGRIRMDDNADADDDDDGDDEDNNAADESEEAAVGKEGWFPKDFVRLIVVPLYAPVLLGVRAARRRGGVLGSLACASVPFAEAINCDIRLGEQLMAAAQAAAAASPTEETVVPTAATATTETETTIMTPSFKRAASESPPNVSPRPMSMQASDMIRMNVIKELLDTEENYVKLLAALCQGYLHELRQRPDIFAADSLAVIFSNVEQLYAFQQGFLGALRLAVVQNRIADTFVQYQTGFMVYSVYCNSYTRALVELDKYTGNVQAGALLESCRLAQNLPELPLSAHLLAPVQRICRYPLHLGELVKHTQATAAAAGGGDDTEGTDGPSGAGDAKEPLETALAAMKHVTEMVNEGKRHSEYLGRVQARFDSFQGPALGAHSTRLFLQTDAIRMTPNLWNNTYTLFLFDNQLVYCKKDLLKRTTYTYKGRIFLATCRIINLPDGKIFGLTLKNALRIYCDLRGKWFDFCFRSASSKLRFLSTLAAERKFSGCSLFVTDFDGVGSSGGGGIAQHGAGGGIGTISNGGGSISSSADDADDAVADDVAGMAMMMLPPPQQLGGYSSTARTIDFGDAGDAGGGGAERAVDVENVMNAANTSDDGESQQQQQKQRSDTLPKKSRKLNRDAVLTTTTAPATTAATSSTNASANNNGYEYSSSSLGRKRIGNWFRKAKSTNTTPSHSPTHQTAPPTCSTNNCVAKGAAAGAAATDEYGIL